MKRSQLVRCLIAAALAMLVSEASAVDPTTAPARHAEAARPAATGGPTEAAGAPAGSAVQQETFLGFELGEEIRYILERADGETNDTLSLWRMSLEEINGDEGVFDMFYDIGIYAPDGRGGTLVGRHEARLWVNRHGFPTRAMLLAQKRTPMGDLQYVIEYMFAEDRYVKTLEGIEREQELELEDIAGIRLSGPSGLFAFAPIEHACLPSAEDLQPAENPSPGAAGGVFNNSNNLTREDYEPPCGGREPLFLNPGLLNLMMPTLWEAGTGSIDFVAFAPTGVVDRVLLGVGGGGSSGFTVGGFNLMPDSGPDPFTEPRYALERFRLAAEGDLQQIDLGDRPVDVWKMVAPPPFEAAYVDGEGSIARLDFPADAETGERFWIRRLRPTEY